MPSGPEHDDGPRTSRYRPDTMTRSRLILRLLLAAAFAAAGVAHLVAPDPFVGITPGWVPRPRAVIAWTGIAEIAGAAGLLVPRLRRAAAWALAAYAVCVFPANVNHAWMDLVATGQAGRPPLPLAYHAPRLAAQPVIVWWCLFAGAIVDWPFRRRAGAAR